jgi:methionyl-tRNA formyltransferase
MLDTIILLTCEFLPQVLADVLLSRNPQLTFQFVSSLFELEAIGPEILDHARLIGFTTDVIVPPAILNALGYGAYNFHPVPPHYPGWFPAPFAIYDGATFLG